MLVLDWGASYIFYTQYTNGLLGLSINNGIAHWISVAILGYPIE